MIRLLSGDLYRISCKISFWLVLFICSAYSLWDNYSSMSNAVDENLEFIGLVNSNTILLNLMLGIVLMLSLYGDEFKSMAFISVIGRGMSRIGFVITKFALSMLLFLGAYVFLAIELLIQANIYGITLQQDEKTVIYLILICEFVNAVTYVAMASIFMYLTGNVPLGVFAYVTVSVVIPLGIEMLKMIPVFERFLQKNYYINGLTSRAATDFVYGLYGEGMLFALGAAVVYAGGALACSAVVFSRKELDF